MAVVYNSKLGKLTFNEDDEHYFALSNEKKEIRIPYIPIIEDEEYNKSDYNLYLFENNYLNAENDVFQIYEKSIKDRIGWIFPITVLESNENKFANNKHLNKYKLVAFKKLLLENYKRYDLAEMENELTISDIFGDDLIILILSKEKCKLIQNFNIENYWPDLATYGYFIKNENKLTVNINIHNIFVVDKFRGNEKLWIRKSNKSLDEFIFIKNLYTKYLKTLDHHLIRFHLFYQIIEHLITEKFEKDFDDLINKYSKNEMQKNDFIEQISNVRNGRGNVRAIFNSINTNEGTLEREIVIDLKINCKDFIEKYKYKHKEDLGDLIYTVRNIIVHNYRGISEDDIVELENITFQFEILIHYLIINY